MAPPPPGEDFGSLSLDSLSLDSLSLDAPASDLAAPGSDLPFEAGLESPFDDLGMPPQSTEEQIELLLRQGDEARAAGDKQQAIEIWSRIFLIDIDNAEAVTRIEDARREMSEEGRRIAALEEGREKDARGGLAARPHLEADLPLATVPPAVPARRGRPPRGAASHLPTISPR